MDIEDLLQEQNERLRSIRLGGGQDQIDKQHQRGKLTARERLDLLLDQDTFLEWNTFAKNRCLDFDLYQKELPGEGVVAGQGKIDGRRAFVFSQDFTVMGGSLGETHAAKICDTLDMAIRMGIPAIGINDSGGARIQEGMGALNGYCSVFFHNSIASGCIPQISIVLGPCAGGAVYGPSLTDFIIMVKGTSRMYITGPDVIRAVTGEEVTHEALGGTKVHGQISGVAHFIVDSEKEALLLARKILSFLPSNSREQPPVVETDDLPDRTSDELRHIIPANSRLSFDVREVIHHTVDRGDFLEIQRDFASNIVVGLARLNGRTAGFVANQPRVLAGCLDSNASCKAARFVRFCDAFNIPLVTLVDCPGFLPGAGQEHNGIIRHGAKLLYAYSEATVPKITVVLRKDYGGAYSAMCGKALGADIVAALPTAEIAVMGPEGAVNIIYRNEIGKAEDPDVKKRAMIEEYRKRYAGPYKAAEWGLVNDIMDPAELRPKLIAYLDALRDKRETRPHKKHDNLPL